MVYIFWNLDISNIPGFNKKFFKMILVLVITSNGGIMQRNIHKPIDLCNKSFYLLKKIKLAVQKKNTYEEEIMDQLTDISFLNSTTVTLPSRACKRHSKEFAEL